MEEEVVGFGARTRASVQYECRVQAARSNRAIYQDAQKKRPEDGDAECIIAAVRFQPEACRRCDDLVGMASAVSALVYDDSITVPVGSLERLAAKTHLY